MLEDAPGPVVADPSGAGADPQHLGGFGDGQPVQGHELDHAAEAGRGRAMEVRRARASASAAMRWTMRSVESSSSSLRPWSRWAAARSRAVAVWWSATR